MGPPIDLTKNNLWRLLVRYFYRLDVLLVTWSIKMSNTEEIKLQYLNVSTMTCH